MSGHENQENGTGKRLMVVVALSALMFGFCYFLAGPSRAVGEAGKAGQGLTEGVNRARENVTQVARAQVSWFQGGGWIYVAAGGSVLILIGTFLGGKKGSG